MTNIKALRRLLSELAPYGWKTLFQQHGLDIDAVDLRKELRKKLKIDRSIPGFREFSLNGCHAITPSLPAHSLLYHALASPLVLWADVAKTIPITKFPTLEELDVVENYVYAFSEMTLERLQRRFSHYEVAIVVFSYQYRNAIDTVHKKHADMVYSRTGVSRIGNCESSYNKALRSFIPLSDDPHQTRVIPAKFNAFIAVKLKGSPKILGQRFNVGVRGDPFSCCNDESLDFWVPIHKLFNGSDCLRGKLLTLDYRIRHTNEKIAKTHEYLSSVISSNIGCATDDWKDFPFRFHKRIAEFDSRSNSVVPYAHSRLVTIAKCRNKNVYLKKFFTLPTQNSQHQVRLRHTSLMMTHRPTTIRNRPGQLNCLVVYPHSVPEFMHIRTELVSTFTGQIRDLNWESDVRSYLENGEFKALHYVDYSGDGFVKLECIKGGGELNQWLNIAAYSIVAPPNLFPYCNQTSIYDDLSLRPLWSILPFALCDTRLLPNIQSHTELHYEKMSMVDTCTALIAGIVNGQVPQTNVEPRVKRTTYLPDAATGVFSPGWDISFDTFYNNGDFVPHLAAYGLASPFPENAQLCADRHSFSPGVTPDIARSFWSNKNHKQTIIPLTDDEIGVPNEPGWDGEIGPILFSEQGKQFVSYADFDRVDYTTKVLKNRINYHILANIDSQEYIRRMKNFAKVKSFIAVQDTMKLVSYVIQVNENVRRDRYLFAVVDDKSRRDCHRLIAERTDSVWLELLNGRKIKVLDFT
ncbi:hypothetical protein [Vibrio profundi]|uniref:hypothetical protein n=1 Tax=Vibrio profundi TaxID=1774960 RepID=UPI0037352E13